MALAQVDNNRNPVSLSLSLPLSLPLSLFFLFLSHSLCTRLRAPLEKPLAARARKLLQLPRVLFRVLEWQARARALRLGWGETLTPSLQSVPPLSLQPHVSTRRGKCRGTPGATRGWMESKLMTYGLLDEQESRKKMRESENHKASERARAYFPAYGIWP